MIVVFTDDAPPHLNHLVIVPKKSCYCILLRWTVFLVIVIFGLNDEVNLVREGGIRDKPHASHALTLVPTEFMAYFAPSFRHRCVLMLLN